MPDATMAVVLLLFLATAIERTVEVAMAALPLSSRDQRRALAVFASLVAAAALSFALQLDLVASLLGAELSATQSQTLTAIALAGGSAPAHELLRLIETLRMGREESPNRNP